MVDLVGVILPVIGEKLCRKWVFKPGQWSKWITSITIVMLGHEMNLPELFFVQWLSTI